MYNGLKVMLHRLIRMMYALLMDKKTHFVAAGILNTLIDFTIFNFAIHFFGMAPWLANIISTSVAMVISFIINKKAVFRDGRAFNHTQFVAYILVTVAGLWGLQTLAIVGISGVIHPAAHSMLGSNAAKVLVPNIAKAIATVISAVWNYLWYDRVIFTRKGAGVVGWM